MCSIIYYVQLSTIRACLCTVFSTNFPIPLHTPWGTLGTPVSFALLVRCCGIEKIDRTIGTGSSGRVTWVVLVQARFPELVTDNPLKKSKTNCVQEVSRVASQLRVKWNTHGSCVLPVNGKPFDWFWLVTCGFFMVWYSRSCHKNTSLVLTTGRGFATLYLSFI